MTILDLDKAEASIRAFNADVEALVNDRLMHRHFRNGAVGKTSVAERVVLLDKLWATQMFRKPGHMRKVIRNLEKDEARIAEALRTLPDCALEESPSDVEAIAEWAMPIALGYEGDAERDRAYSPYSFATKYLHWTAPNHFPVVDSYARAVVNRIQREKGMTPRVWAGSGYWPDDYPRWITFYNRLLASLSQADRDHLRKLDYDSQPLGDRVRNTLVRIIDKAFYWWEWATVSSAGSGGSSGSGVGTTIPR